MFYGNTFFVFQTHLVLKSIKINSQGNLCKSENFHKIRWAVTQSFNEFESIIKTFLVSANR